MKGFPEYVKVGGEKQVTTKIFPRLMRSTKTGTVAMLLDDKSYKNIIVLIPGKGTELTPFQANVIAKDMNDWVDYDSMIHLYND